MLPFFFLDNNLVKSEKCIMLAGSSWTVKLPLPTMAPSNITLHWIGTVGVMVYQMPVTGLGLSSST